MANRRMDPQNMVEEIVRTNIYQHTFWKEQCFGLTAETLVDKAMELDHIGGTFGGNSTPTPFICLLLKMLQIQPEKDIVVEFIKNHDYKYVRILGAFYLRLTGSDVDVYRYLEPLYNDHRKVRQKLSDGRFSLTHVDQVIEELLTKDYSCDIAMPSLEKRWTLEQNGSLEPRISVLEDHFEEEEEKEENEGIAEKSEDEKDHHRKSPERERDMDRRPDSHRHRFSAPQFCDIGETSSSAKRSKTEFSEGFVDSVPHDLQMKIAEEFPVKSLLRFLSVSKLWESTFRNQDFRDSYLSNSLTRSPERQGLLFTFACRDKCFVFSSPRLENPYQASSSTVASYNLTCQSSFGAAIAPSVHGLICYCGPASRLVLYNPCTRESVSLPMTNLEMGRRTKHYVGYDPVDSVYKVLCLMQWASLTNEHDLAEILTLGNEHQHLWRIVDVPQHSPTSHEMCIDGVLYYGAFTGEDLTQPSIMRFDVRSEVFEVITGPENGDVMFLTSYSKLTSYQGKLAVIFMEDQVVLWVLRDDGWLKTSFDLPSALGFTTELHLQLFSGTSAGEIILAPVFLHASTFRVVYYDPNKDSFKKIEIEGITERNVPHEVVDWGYCRTISVFPYQVENLLFLKTKHD